MIPSGIDIAAAAVIIDFGEPSANVVIAGVVDLIPLGRTVVFWWVYVPASVEAQVNASALWLVLDSR